MAETKTVAEATENQAPVKEAAKTMLNASIDPKDFDWDAFEGGDIYGGQDKAKIEAAGGTVA